MYKSVDRVTDDGGQVTELRVTLLTRDVDSTYGELYRRLLSKAYETREDRAWRIHYGADRCAKEPLAGIFQNAHKRDEAQSGCGSLMCNYDCSAEYDGQPVLIRMDDSHEYIRVVAEPKPHRVSNSISEMRGRPLNPVNFQVSMVDGQLLPEDLVQRVIDAFSDYQELEPAA